MYKDTRLGGVEKWYNFPPSDANMRIPNELLHSVCFLCVKYQEQYQAIGTAFFVKFSKDEFDFCHLFTAKHIIDEVKKQGYETLYARLNKYGTGVEYEKLGDINSWLLTEDIEVDIAFLPFLLDQSKFEAKTIPLEMIANENIMKTRAIGIGDDLFSIGLFTQRKGNKRNIPIVRTGIISAMPTEPLLSKFGDEIYFYLAELRSISGLSGSPVFVYLDKTRIYIPNSPEKNDFEFYLLGVMRGHWDAKNYNDIEPLGDESKQVIEPLNTGIAMITPASYILAFLESPQMVEWREKVVANYKKNETHDNFTED